MFTHDSVPRVRRPLILLTICAWLVLGGLAGPAAADTPAAWEQAPDVSPLGFLMIVLILPVGAALVISLLSVLPSIVKGDPGYQPGKSWAGHSEWFGGPTKGLKGADEVSPQQLEQSGQDAGGTSGRW